MSRTEPALGPQEESAHGLPWGRFLVVFLLVLADQLSKSQVFAWLGDRSAEGLVRDHHGHLRYELLGDWLGLMLHTNRGAAFGQFQDFPHLLVGGRVIAVLCLVYLCWRAERRPWMLFWAICLVLGGAIGNLVDNLWTGGVEVDHPYRTVRDFIDVWFLSERFGWDSHFPTFNVADSCISVGAVLWILSGLFSKETETVTEEEPAEEALS